MKKKLSFPLKFAICAISSFMVVCALPLQLHSSADYSEDLNDALDFFGSVEGAAITGMGSQGVAVAGGIWTIKQCLDNPITTGDGTLDASTLSILAGQYYRNIDGVRTTRIGSVVLLSGDYAIGDGEKIPFLMGQDYDVTLSPSVPYTSIRSVLTPSGNDYILSVQGLGRSGGFSFDNSVTEEIAYTYTAYYQPSLLFNAVSGAYLPPFYNMADLALYSYDSATWGRPDLLGNIVRVNLPAGNIYSEDYYNTLSDWVAATAPDFAYLVPYKPPVTIVPGIPSNWLEEPNLPTTPDYQIYFPDTSFPVFDLSAYLPDVSFWWDLQKLILAQYTLQPFAITLLGLGALLYALHMMGGGN